MSVRQRGKSWLVDVKVHGRRFRQTVRDREEARHLEADKRKELLENQLEPHGLEEALAKYLTEYVPHLKDQRGQRSKAKTLRPYIHEKTFADIHAIVGEIKKEKTQPATRNRRLALLRRLCSLAFKEWGWLHTPVGQKITLMREHGQRHIYLHRAQVEEIASYCDGGAADAIRLAAYTGLRRGEIFRLTKENIKGNLIILAADTKTGQPRVIPVHRAVKGIVKRLPLLTTDALLRKEWVAARKKAGLDHVRFHDLRHTMASWLVQSGASLAVVGEILGHSQAQTTRRYAHLSSEALVRAVNKIK